MNDSSAFLYTKYIYCILTDFVIKLLCIIMFMAREKDEEITLHCKYS